jgi:hypothetical protein
MRAGVLGAFGSVGIGLVWGWLIGSLTGRTYRPVRTFLSIFLVTSAIAAQVMLFLDWIRLLLFLGAALFALFIHIEWRSTLLQLKNSQNP